MNSEGRNLNFFNRGSILLITLSVLFVLFIFGLSYSRFMIRKAYLTNRLGQKREMAGLAHSLALLASHKLAYSTITSNVGPGPIPEDSSCLKPLYEYLARPIASFEKEKGFPLLIDEDASEHFDLLLDQLWHASEIGDSIEESIDLIVRKADFDEISPAGAAYPAEKRGKIGILVKLSKFNGDKFLFDQDFNFCIGVRITAALVPLLSKFNLYIEKTGIVENGEEHGLNTVSVNADGNLARTRTRAFPLELNNDDNQALPVKTSFNDLVNASRGLVYLGGDANLFLNLARSDVSDKSSDSGEGFHTFKREDYDGFVPAHTFPTSSGRINVSIMEQGVSDDPSPINQTFYSAIDSGFPGWTQINLHNMKLSSIFRLMGTQRKPSPTLVLGNVYGQILRISKLQTITSGPVRNELLWNMSFMPPMQPAKYYVNEIIKPPLADFKTAFSLTTNYASFQKYLKDCASRVGNRPYNRALPYILNQKDHNSILSFPSEDPLHEYLKQPSATARHAIPTSLAAIFPAVSNLKSMTSFKDGFSSLIRCNYVIEHEEGKTIEQQFRKRGLMAGNKLALNGWVMLKGFDLVKLDQSWEYVANGGIILDTGNIEIASSLRPTPFKPELILYLVTLNGGITFNNAPEDDVQAAFIAYAGDAAEGRIKFAAPPAQIRGALAMRTLIRTKADAESFKGTKLRYFAPLAALPAGVGSSEQERALLSWSFQPMPMEVEF